MTHEPPKADDPFILALEENPGPRISTREFEAQKPTAPTFTRDARWVECIIDRLAFIVTQRSKTLRIDRREWARRAGITPGYLDAALRRTKPTSLDTWIRIVAAVGYDLRIDHALRPVVGTSVDQLSMAIESDE